MGVERIRTDEKLVILEVRVLMPWLEDKETFLQEFRALTHEVARRMGRERLLHSVFTGSTQVFRVGDDHWMIDGLNCYYKPEGWLIEGVQTGEKSLVAALRADTMFNRVKG